MPRPSVSVPFLLRSGTVAQTALLSVLALAWLTEPVRQLHSYRSAVHRDPTTDIGPWIVPLLLGLTALCVLAATGCMLAAVAAPVCAWRLPRRGAFITLVGVEAVAWLAPLAHTSLLGTAVSFVLAGLLLALGIAVVALATASPRTRRPIASPRAASRGDDTYRAPRRPAGRRH